MVGQHTTVRLTRDNTATPWGFRLQGGLEANSPLTVQRVFVGGVSDGQLQRGDVIVGIENHDSTNMYHSQAEEIIKSTGRQLTLNVRRGDSDHGGYSNGSGHMRQVSQGGGGGGWGGGGGAWGGGGGGEGWGDNGVEEEPTRSIGEIKQLFSKQPEPTTPPHHSYGGIRHNVTPGKTSYVPKRPVFRPQGGPDISEPGWVPKNKPYPLSPSRFGPSTPVSPPVNRRPQGGGGGGGGGEHRRRVTPPRHEPAEPPAWLGTLRSSGGPRMWELQDAENLKDGGPKPARVPGASRPVQSQAYPGGGGGGRGAGGGGGGRVGSPVVVHNPKVQSLRYGPGSDSPVYEQHTPDGSQSSSTARVAHLQYNTPIGLYSKENALDALQGQTKGKPGAGTLQITGDGGGRGGQFDPSIHSDVYRLIKEEEAGGGARGGGPRGPSGGRRPPPQRQPPHGGAGRPSHHDDMDSQSSQHSSRFSQLVNENNDQLEEYLRMPHHSTAYGPPGGGGGGGGYRGAGTGHGGHGMEQRFGDMGISDF